MSDDVARAGPNQPPIPAVIYAAKSTEDRRGSIGDQLSECRRAAGNEGRAIIAEQSDEGFSAYSGCRGPGLAEAKRLAVDAAAAFGEAELWCWHSDRLARGVGDRPEASPHLLEIFFEMNRAAVRLRSVEDDLVLNNPLLAAAQGWRNHEDSRVKGERVRAGLRRRVARGKPVGGPPPYGYQWAADGSGLEVQPAEAALVSRVFRAYIAGERQAQIARDLNAEGVATRTAGSRWHQGTIRGILANAMYIGQVRYRDESFDGSHAPIIDTASWRVACEIREANARGRGKGRGRPARKFLLSAGLLQCGVCGANMVPRTARNRRGAPYERYYCFGRKSDPSSCWMGPVPRSAVDEGLVFFLTNATVDVERTRQQFLDTTERRLHEARTLREQAERELIGQKVRRDRMWGYLQEGRITPEEWKTFAADNDQAHAGALEQRDRLLDQEAIVAAETRQLGIDAVELVTNLRRMVADDLTAADTIDTLRTHLRRIFHHFVLHPGAGFGHVGLQVHTGSADYVLQPIAHPESIVKYLDVPGTLHPSVPTEEWTRMPIYRREPLHLRVDNKADGLVT